MTTPTNVTLTDAPVVTPPAAPAKPMSFIAQAGVGLAQWVLVIISVFIVIALALLAWSEARSFFLVDSSYSQLLKPELSKETAEAAKTLIEQLEAQRKAFRDFWLQLMQIVLVNVLLPILTAILGYVFGSREGNR